jgi:hypothetical protein
LSTRIHIAVDDDGQPARVHLTEGQRHDVTCDKSFLEGLELRFVIGDKRYDGDPVRSRMRSSPSLSPTATKARSGQSQGRGPAARALPPRFSSLSIRERLDSVHI